MTKEQKSQLIALAKSLIGRPYKYGAQPEEAPNFFDCSSFIQYIFKQIGINLPRSTILQAEKGKKIKLKDLQPGDLLFFHSRQGHYSPKFPQGIGHVALYIGDGKTIHAASRRVRKNPIKEIGKVKEQSLKILMKKLKPLVIIKRL